MTVADLWGMFVTMLGVLDVATGHSFGSVRLEPDLDWLTNGDMAIGP